MVSASDVKTLRERSGAGMMDCKKALQEANGDMEKASELLREKGLAAAVKKAGNLVEIVPDACGGLCGKDGCVPGICEGCGDAHCGSEPDVCIGRRN